MNKKREYRYLPVFTLFYVKLYSNLNKNIASNYWCFKYGTVIYANEDLNNIVKFGNYYCQVNVNAETLKNCPTKDAFTMKVYSSVGSGADNYIAQELTTYKGRKFLRCCGGDKVWGNWGKIVLNSDLSIINNSTLVTSTVPSGITTAIRTITIPPGTYLITGLLTFNESINVQCNYSIDSDKGMLVMCRSLGIYGGGQSPCTLENFTETTKIILNAYQNSGKSVDIAYSNLKLIKFK